MRTSAHLLALLAATAVKYHYGMGSHRETLVKNLNKHFKQTYFYLADCLHNRVFEHLLILVVNEVVSSNCYVTLCSIKIHYTRFIFTVTFKRKMA